MLGALDPSRRDVTIVGAGISGLLAAYELDKAGFAVTLLEASDRAGGLIRTTRTADGIAESAAHSLLLTPEVEELFSDLGIGIAEVRSKGRYVLRSGVARRFPLGLLEAGGALFRAYFALADSRIPPERLTLEQWGRRFVGEATTRFLLTPFVRGIYGVNPGDLCVGAAFPALQVPHGHSLLSRRLGKLLRREPGGSPRRPPSRMIAPAEGMGSVVETLTLRLQEKLGQRFRLGAPATSLPDAGNVVLAVPAAAAAELLESREGRLAAALRGIAYTPLMSVTAFVDRADVARPLEGVGILFPDGEGRKALGILFNSSAFEKRVSDEARVASFTLIFGGASGPEQLDLSDSEVENAALAELRAVLGVARLRSVAIHRWNRAVPRYDGRLMDAWELANKTWCARPGRILFGNYTGQVSLRGMIQSAAALGRKTG